MAYIVCSSADVGYFEVKENRVARRKNLFLKKETPCQLS
jgi:hypothetical protein